MINQRYQGSLAVSLAVSVHDAPSSAVVNTYAAPAFEQVPPHPRQSTSAFGAPTTMALPEIATLWNDDRLSLTVRFSVCVHEAPPSAVVKTYASVKLPRMAMVLPETATPSVKKAFER